MANNDDDKKDKKQVSPPYIPFKTFLRLIRSFKETAVPDRIDASVLDKFSWSERSALLPALKFLQLADKEDKSTPAIYDLTKAYTTEEWKAKLKEIILSRYDEIINGLNVETGATRGQLEEKFKNVGAGVVEKCIRFYIAAAKEADVTLSKHITKRQKTARKKQSAKEPDKPKDQSKMEPTNPEDLGFKEFILPIKDKQPVKIWIPDKLSEDDWRGVRKMMNPMMIMIEAYFGFSQEDKKE